ncbi:hypothetical protein X975_13612, partial [Stegodyphus mimosarum]
MDMNYSTVWRVLRGVIGFYPYKISRLHELKPSDYDKRVTFPLSFLARVEIDYAFPWHILWGDECHFYLNGSVNTQNSRIWASEQPHTVHEIPLKCPKVTVWCGFTAEFVIGSFFFDRTPNVRHKYRKVPQNAANICYSTTSAKKPSPTDNLYAGWCSATH